MLLLERYHPVSSVAVGLIERLNSVGPMRPHRAKTFGPPGGGHRKAGGNGKFYREGAIRRFRAPARKIPQASEGFNT
jgi:hypothetical protein